MIDDEIVAAVGERGGLRAIAISHPHYYTTMVEWARAFGCRILIHEDDAEWVMRPDDSVRPWSGETYQVAPGITLLRLGGQPHGQVLHWDGRRLLLSGDIVQVIPDRAHVSFMYSYPNLIPPARHGRRHRPRLEPWDFDTIVGAWWGTIVSGGKEAVRRSARRYRDAIEGKLTRSPPIDLPARHARNVQLLGRPRIRPEPRQHLFLRVGLDHVQRAVVGQHPARQDEAVVREALHERGVLVPAVPRACVPAPVPLRATLAQDDERAQLLRGRNDVVVAVEEVVRVVLGLDLRQLLELGLKASSTTPSPSSAKLM